MPRQYWQRRKRHLAYPELHDKDGWRLVLFYSAQG